MYPLDPVEVVCLYPGEITTVSLEKVKKAHGIEQVKNAYEAAKKHVENLNHTYKNSSQPGWFFSRESLGVTTAANAIAFWRTLI